MIGADFASALRDRRAHFNRRVLEAQRRFPGFDRGQLSAFLNGPADALVAAVARHDAARVPQLVDTVFDLVVELCGHGLAQAPAVQGVWSTVAPQCVHVLATQPEQVLGALSNAAIHLTKSGNADSGRWLQEMAALAPQVDDLTLLRALGQVLAWRAGLAHFRHAALEAADALPPTLALQACAVHDASGWTSFREQMRANPWHGIAPSEAARGVRVGAFSGLGGEFPAPPQLRAANDGFWVHSAGRHFRLMADRFGAALHGANDADYQQAAATRVASGVELRDSSLLIGQRVVALDWPTGPVTIVCNEHTVALTSPFTHAIRLFPLR